jgi:hypothetical protein
MPKLDVMRVMTYYPSWPRPSDFGIRQRGST